MIDVPTESAPVAPPPMRRRQFLRRAVRAALATTAATCLYTWRIEPHWIEVVRRRLPLAQLPSSLVGKRLVQISDLHAGPRVDQSYLLAAAERVASLAPDLIVVTGDFMSCRGVESIPQALDVVRALPAAPLGRFAVLGNHDYGSYWRSRATADKLADGLERAGVRLLRNEVASTAGLQLAGVDDLWSERFDAERMMADVAADAPTIALCHNPDGVDEPAFRSFRGWILAGHTHGGQCKAPFLPPPLLPVKNRRYVAGAYDLGPERRLYINRGLGHLLEVRFNCRPEMTLFTLERA
jgi:hypothetical protein